MPFTSNRFCFIYIVYFWANISHSTATYGAYSHCSCVAKGILPRNIKINHVWLTYLLAFSVEDANFAKQAIIPWTIYSGTCQIWNCQRRCFTDQVSLVPASCKKYLFYGQSLQRRPLLRCLFDKCRLRSAANNHFSTNVNISVSLPGRTKPRPFHTLTRPGLSWPQVSATWLTVQDFWYCMTASFSVAKKGAVSGNWLHERVHANRDLHKHDFGWRLNWAISRRIYQLNSSGGRSFTVRSEEGRRVKILLG